MSSNTIPSLRQYVVGRTKSAMIKAVCAAILVGALMATFATVFHYVTLVNNSVTTFSTIISQSITFGDSFQSERQANSLAKANVFSAVWITTPDFEYLIGFGGISDLPLDTLKSKLLSSSWTLVIDRSFPEILSRHRLVNIQGDIVGNLVVALPLPLVSFMMIVVIFAIVAALMATVATIQVRHVAQDVSESIVNFSNLIKNFTTSETKIEEVDFSAYLEIRDLRKAFMKLICNLSEAERREADLAKRAATAQVTQMLAHDVRKPFSILKMGLSMLGNTQNPDELKKILSRLIPEIDKAASSVDGLIADVMEIGSTSLEILWEEVSPEVIIRDSLHEVFKMHPKADIKIEYDLQHKHMVKVHAQKIGRALSNIFGNAVQAMSPHGTIWVKTIETSDMIEFCLGNSDSFIAQDDIPKLFDAFFTKGKRSGTGLGLAIAQKVINDHGGKIWCRSIKSTEHPSGKVEFWFTLPVAKEPPSNVVVHDLPARSSDINRILAFTSNEADSNQDNIKRVELSLESDIASTSAALGRPIAILLVDDEVIYQSGLASFLTHPSELARNITVTHAISGEEALTLSETNFFDLVVTDIDMGGGTIDGFELVDALRSNMESRSFVCVHSNRMCASDFRRAAEYGADAFLPKPMARAQLLKQILQAATLSHAPHRQEAGPTTPKPEVVVLDDNAFILEAWNARLNDDAIVHTFDGPEALVARIATEPSFLTKVSYVVTDYHFENSTKTGYDVGCMIKQMRSDIIILLSSDGKFDLAAFADNIDLVIPKNPISYFDLQQSPIEGKLHRHSTGQPETRNRV